MSSRFSGSRLKCRQCAAGFWRLISPHYSDKELEAAYVSCQADRIAACGAWSCTFSAGVLASHALVEAANDGEEHRRIISLSMLQIALPCAMLTCALYFGVRAWIRFKMVPDEVLAALSGLLLTGGMILLSPLRFSVVGEDQHFSAPCACDSCAWMEALTTQVLSLLIVLWMPLKSRTVGLLLLASLGMLYLSDGFGKAFAFMSCASLLLYGGARRAEYLSRLAFASLHQQKELSALCQQKEANAKSNMALARSLQSLAGRRCDLVVILDANLAIWRPTPLQDMFFKQDMQEVLLPAVLPVSEQEMFLSLVRRVSEHKSVEALALTLPQGRAKVILEYAGCEEDRFVMSILLDENADQVFNLDDGLIPSMLGWCVENEAKTGKAASLAGSTEDSLCYSMSEDPNKSSKKSSTLDLFSDTASTTLRWRPSMVDQEVQVNDTELEVVVKRNTASATGKPPPLPQTAIVRRCPSSSSESGSRGGRSRRRRASPMSPKRSRSQNSQDSQELLPNLPLMKLTAPFYQPTSKACSETSILWLLQHWNFTYATVDCCPWHAALSLAGRLLKSHKQDGCNPLWSPFTGWQCEFCTGMNHSHSAICDLCGSGRPGLVHEEPSNGSRSLDDSCEFRQDDGALRASAHLGKENLCQL